MAAVTGESLSLRGPSTTMLTPVVERMAQRTKAIVKNIDHVLARWAALDDRDSDGNPGEGYFTSSVVNKLI
jgi:hypothetical protein